MATKRQKYEAKVLHSKEFKTVPHSFTKKVMSWVYCSGCGLVALNNESTRKRIARNCESMEE